jgi:hypothetical protein
MTAKSEVTIGTSNHTFYPISKTLGYIAGITRMESGQTLDAVKMCHYHYLPENERHTFDAETALSVATFNGYVDRNVHHYTQDSLYVEVEKDGYITGPLAWKTVDIADPMGPYIDPKHIRKGAMAALSFLFIMALLSIDLFLIFSFIAMIGAGVLFLFAYEHRHKWSTMVKARQALICSPNQRYWRDLTDENS